MHPSFWILILLASFLYGTKTVNLKLGIQAIPSQINGDLVGYLRTLQGRMITNITNIKHQLNIKSPLIQNTKDLDTKIQILEGLLLAQRQVLVNIIQSYHYDLNSTSWVCASFSPITKSSLVAGQIQFKTAFDQLNGQLHNLQSLPSYKPTANLFAQISNFWAASKSPIPAVGNENNNFKTYRTVNYNAGFWALGNSTVQNINVQLSNNNLPFAELCPFYMPFADREGNCRQCPMDRPYFILQSRSCFSCKVYNKQKRECLDQKGNAVGGIVYFSNFAAGRERMLLLQNQSIASYSNNTQKLPLCPSQTPFFSGTFCIDCPKDLLFSLSELTCRTCPTGQYYQKNTMSCKQLYYYSRAESLSWSSTSKTVLRKSNESYAECPQKTPFSNNISCVTCPKPSHFSYDNFKCQTCPKGTILNLNMHRCLAPGNLNYQTNPTTTPNLIFNGKSMAQWATVYEQKVSDEQGISDCPKETPYFDGIACISCPKPHPYFNLATLVCQFCQGTTIYDRVERECLASDRGRAMQRPTWQKMAAAVFS